MWWPISFGSSYPLKWGKIFLQRLISFIINLIPFLETYTFDLSEPACTFIKKLLTWTNVLFILFESLAKATFRIKLVKWNVTCFLLICWYLFFQWDSLFDTHPFFHFILGIPIKFIYIYEVFIQEIKKQVTIFRKATLLGKGKKKYNRIEH